jgi:agmatinase
MDTRFTSSEFTPHGVPLSEARMVVLPVPYDLGLSWMPGARLGPRAILEASQEVERFNYDTFCAPADAGIATAPAFGARGEESASYESRIQTAARQYLEADKFILSLGGDHSITFPLVCAHHAHFAAQNLPIGIMHLDAHTDLWPTYQGTSASHATPMYRLANMGIPIVSAGLRVLTPEDFERARTLPVKLLPMYNLRRRGMMAQIEAALERLPQHVYLSLDLDALDPSEMPAVGTPMPGGFRFDELLEVLELLFSKKTVVGADLVEFSPAPGLHFPQMTAAQLAYDLLGLKALQAKWVEEVVLFDETPTGTQNHP